MSLKEKLKRVSKISNDTPSMENCPGVVFEDVEHELKKISVTAEFSKKSSPSKVSKLSKNCSVDRFNDIVIMHGYEVEGEAPWEMDGVDFGDSQICANIASLLYDGDTENGISTTAETFVGTPANHEFVKGGRK